MQVVMAAKVHGCAGRGWLLSAVLLAVVNLLSVGVAWSKTPHSRPNIIVILADDLGYGDLGSYGAIKIRTPHMDRLAREGMRFTDAHSPHSVCSPSRYGLLTGRYAWRAWGGHNAVFADDPLLIDPQRLTVPKLLKAVGYRTAIIGKWHLGFGAPGTPGWDDKTGPDYNGELRPGPLEVGFDYFFGYDSTGHYIENHRIVGLDPSDPIRLVLDERWQRQKHSYYDRLGIPAHKVAGGESARYRVEEISDAITTRAVKWIEHQGSRSFFLYFAQRLPHAPLVTSARFEGTSEIGPYGDVMNELDASVGELLATLDRRGLAKNTIVILASDNGGVSNYMPSTEAHIAGHKLNGPLFGQKTEVFEGGTRVPFLIRWPGVVEPGTTTNALVSLTDVMATMAELTGTPLPHDAAEDSFSFLHLLRGAAPTQAVRKSVIMDGYAGVFAIREAQWKLIDGPGGGAWSAGGGGLLAGSDPGEYPVQLYDLSTDLGERANLYMKHPEIASRLRGKLREIKYGGRSR